MKNRLLFKIPFVLLYSRLVVAFFMTIFSFIKISPTIIIALTIYAIISDIFDGIIARKLKISSQEMRRLDTKIDTIFWFSCLFYICLNHADFLKSNLLKQDPVLPHQFPRNHCLRIYFLSCCCYRFWIV